ncbi:MAG: endonuclease/exonuclease/phosphatase family protein [Holophaga sp.]|nr:endonuclease/exonuclease/phosphatase family protein [Holophaga sp.]
MTGPAQKALPAAMALYGVALAVITCVNYLGAEHWWFGALNLYLPQAMWAVPGLLLLAVAWSAGRNWIWLPALFLVWVLGPIMGFCWSAQRHPEPRTAPVIRVLTCNAKFGIHDSDELLNDIVRYHPEVVLLQEAGGFLKSPYGKIFKRWNVRSSDQFLIASRLPFAAAEVQKVGNADFFRCRVSRGGSPITLYSVHLQSPREGLNAFRTDRDGHWHPLDAIQELEGNAAIRLQQVHELQKLVASESGPVILGGDLNSPQPSRVCAILEGAGLRDAFGAGGRGYGYTYGHYLLQHRIPWLHLSWMRLDHIMTSTHLQVWRCWVGNGKASDHRPVIADLILEKH